MHHQRTGRKLGRTKDQRRALMKSLMNNLVLYGKIETTEAKAKELRPKIEKLVTKAKSDNLASRRYLTKFLTQKNTKKLISEIAPKYKTRNGGYTRLIKMRIRKGDASPMSVIEFV
jgi:large subunit ribosomal protein L17